MTPDDGLMIGDEWDEPDTIDTDWVIDRDDANDGENDAVVEPANANVDSETVAASGGLRCATCAHAGLTCAECGGLTGFRLTALPPCGACRERIASNSQLWGSEFIVGVAANGEILDMVIT